MFNRLSTPPPEAVAMVLADHVHRDPATGKFSILGTYNSVLMPGFPCPCQPLQVYAALTDGRGLVPLRLALTDADEEEEFCAAEGAAYVADPTRMWEVVFQLCDVMLPSPGQYRLQLSSGDHVLRELRLYAAAIAAVSAAG